MLTDIMLSLKKCWVKEPLYADIDENIEKHCTDACLTKDIARLDYIVHSPNFRLFSSVEQKEMLCKSFVAACAGGSLDIVRYLLHDRHDLPYRCIKKKANLHYKNEKGLKMACRKGHLPVVRYLLSSPELLLKGLGHADILANQDDYAAIVWACGGGHLEVVKYLLHSDELKVHANLFDENNQAFEQACRNGHWAVMRYLLTHPPLDKSPWVQHEINNALIYACTKGDLASVKFLLISPQLLEATGMHAHIHVKQDECFINAYEKAHHDILAFLVFDYEIDLTPQIKTYMQDKPDLMLLFEKRSLYHELNKDMAAKPSSPIKKI